MNKVAQFFDRQSERFGPSGVLPHHESRAQRLRRIAGGPPLRLLELGCGSGGAATACARMGYEVTAVELSPKRAGFARGLASEEGEGRLTVREGDFYWWSTDGEADALEQSVRCYAPPDLALLLEDTGLRVERFEVDDAEGMSKLPDAYSYLAVLRR